MESKKTLIVSGCSFTAHDHNWPFILQELFDFNMINSAVPSQGNGLISRKIIHDTNQAGVGWANIAPINTEDIVVGVMWSAIDRSERYISHDDMYVGPPFQSYNPTNVTEYKWDGWRLMLPDWQDSQDCRLQYRVFNHVISSTVYTLEHILRVQWYLKRLNIKYFMSTMQKLFDPELVKIREISYLYNMVDWEKFLPVEGCLEWVQDNYKLEGFDPPKEDGFQDLHPTRFGHEKFTEEIILPYLKQNDIIL